MNPSWVGLIQRPRRSRSPSSSNTASVPFAPTASQVAVDDPWFFSVPEHTLRAIYPHEDLTLLATHVLIERNAGGMETDLFSGIN
jgi:hypothetical protein